jgi:predicted nucleic acid-binding protein
MRCSERYLPTSESQRESIGDFDELIACIAMANGSAIVTRDDHFQAHSGIEGHLVLKNATPY